MTSLREQAMCLADAGWRVFPLAPGSKDPALGADWRRIATADSAKVFALWTDPVMDDAEQPFNIGIALDADVLVVDVDVRDGKRGAESLRLLEMLYDPLPPTLTDRTATGGEHRFYRVNGKDGPFGKELAEHIDLKTLGGYVVGPGSIIGEREYAWIDADAAIVDFPESLMDLARRSAPTRIAAGQGAPDEALDDPASIAKAIDYLEHDAPDSGTYKIACRVKDFGVSEETAVELLDRHWAEPRSLGKDVEHIAVRVRNAYAYGQSPVGVVSPAPAAAAARAEAEFSAVDVIDRRTKPASTARPKLYFDRWRDSAPQRTDSYLIEGWYDQGAMVVSYGESNVGKSNIALSQAVAVATGQDWSGAKVRQGLVVYVAAEGARGFRKRIEAYKRRFGLKDIPFALVPCPVDLLRPGGDTKALIALIAEAEAAFGMKCAMVVVDTLSRALAGGNENAPDDMGALVMHCDRIRAATGATLHLIHHSGKNLAAGARGHSALRAATDTEIEIAGERGRGTIRGTKQRDIERSLQVVFEYEVVSLGTTDGGAPLTSIVTHVRTETEFETRLSGENEDAYAALVALIRARAGLPADKEGKADITDKMLQIDVGMADWQDALLARNLPASEGSARNRRVALNEAGMVQIVVAGKKAEKRLKLLPRNTPQLPASVELAG